MSHAAGSSMGAKLLWAALALSVVGGVTGAGCSRGGDADGDPPAGGASGTSTTAGGASLDQRDAALRLSVAATGMNLVASEVGIRTFRGGAADYCRAGAPAELEPHRSALEAAGDPTVRQRAQVALTQLGEVLALCARGADSTALQQALERYRASFEPLRQRIESLVAAG